MKVIHLGRYTIHIYLLTYTTSFEKYTFFPLQKPRVDKQHKIHMMNVCVSLITSFISNLTANISTALDDRLAAFKRELVDEQGNSLPVLKSNGNKQQFQHELKVIEKLEDAKCAFEQKKV